jgi:hypothetical protein
MTTLFKYNDGSLLSPVSARFLITIPVWEANRVLDTDHVRALEAAIEKVEHVQGPFTVIKYRNEETNTEEWRIIDGQHRQEVIRRHFDRNSGVAVADFQVLCRRYNTTDHVAAIKIFQAINNAKPMIYTGSPEQRLQEMVKALQGFFISERGGSQLMIMIRPSCNRPCLSVEHLITALKKHGIHERSDLTPDMVIAHAETMNAKWATGPEVCSVKITTTIWGRAQEYGFYLGLDPKCSWLAGL